MQERVISAEHNGSRAHFATRAGSDGLYGSSVMSLGEFGFVAAGLAEGRQWQYPNLGAPKSAD